MITLPSSLVRTLRLVFSRGLGLSARSRQPPLQFQAQGDAVVVRISNDFAALEYRKLGTLTGGTFAVPLEALKRCESTKSDSVTFEPKGGDKVILSWQEGGIPQMAQFPLESPAADFPRLPERTESHGPELLAALREAVNTTDSSATRYALSCLQLGAGKPGNNEGRIVATDGRQLLVQSGFHFPWEGEVLVPANRILACRELLAGSQVEIGKSEGWLTLRIGDWTVHLRIEKETKFPRIDDHLPEDADASSTLHFSEADAKFVLETINRLPASKESSAPVTVDLNGQVAIRAQAEDQPTPTELVLSGSSYQGQPALINTNREFLARALSLGFRQVHFRGEEVPAYCQADGRIYVWTLLEKDGAIKSAPNITRITSGSSDNPATVQVNHSRRPKAPMPKPNNIDNGHASNDTDHDENQHASLLDQAEKLRDTLNEALAQTRDLIAALKRQKKQTRLMQTTLQSLRQLQSIGP